VVYEVEMLRNGAAFQPLDNLPQGCTVVARLKMALEHGPSIAVLDVKNAETSAYPPDGP